MVWTIWSREYSEGDPAPRLYSDRSHLVKHARRVAITHSCLYGPMVLILAVNLKTAFTTGLGSSDTRFLWLGILTLAPLLMFGVYTLKAWFYYRRVRNQATEKL